MTIHEVEIRVPLVDGPIWLMDELVPYGDVDGPEEDGKFSVYYVQDKTVAEVESIVNRLLVKTGATDEYEAVTEDGRVLLKPLALATWLVPLNIGSGLYPRAVKAVCKQVNLDAAWYDWWAQAPFARLAFHHGTNGWLVREHEGDLVVYSSLDNLEAVSTQKGQAVREAAAVNVRAVLTHVAEWLHEPAPDWTFS